MSGPNELVATLAKALRSARTVIATDLRETLAFSCPRGPDGEPDRSQMDPYMEPTIKRYERVLKKIDKALQ